MQNVLTIIPVAMMLVSSIVTIVGVIVMLRHRTDTIQRDLDKEETEVNNRFNKLEQNIKEQTTHMAQIIDDASKQLSQALTMIKIHSTEQAVINKVTGDTLSGLLRNWSDQQKTISDLSTEIAVLKHHAASKNDRA